MDWGPLCGIIRNVCLHKFLSCKSMPVFMMMRIPQYCVIVSHIQKAKTLFLQLFMTQLRLKNGCKRLSNFQWCQHCVLEWIISCTSLSLLCLISADPECLLQSARRKLIYLTDIEALLRWIHILLLCAFYTRSVC